MGNFDLFAIFLTGLFVGGISCMAVQGGLLAATITRREEENLQHNAKKVGHIFPLVSFLLAKIIAYTLLGFFLGWFGSVLKLSLSTQLIMQVAVVIFMLGTAGNLLNLHPVFRYFIIQPPKFLTRFIWKESKSSSLFAPIILGLFTVFIPCGTTQAMMALAIGSGHPLIGATILLAFTLGTSPVFFVLGLLATVVKGTFQTLFSRAAAIALIVLAVYNLNNIVALTGSTWTLENIAEEIYCTVSFCPVKTLTADPLSSPVITFNKYGYSPVEFSIKAGQKVNLTLNNKEGMGCIQEFTIPSLGIQKIIPIGSTETINFIAPAEAKEIAFMCGMGMYRGVMHVL